MILSRKKSRNGRLDNLLPPSTLLYSRIRGFRGSMEGKGNMERLTRDKEVSEMNVCELAYNSCYAKDGKARYRDFEDDFDARELTINLLEKYADIPNEFTCDEDFDDFMVDALQYGTDDMLGFIAVFYRNLWAMADLRGRLKEYEDLEEQGKLMKLPCAVGDTIYTIYSDEDSSFIEEPKVVEVSTHRVWIDSAYFDYDDFGKTVFLTREEAEAALKEL